MRAQATMPRPIFLLLILFPMLLACSGVDVGDLSNRHRIEGALNRLLARTNDDAFVILEHRPSGKFVQFAGAANQPLLLDLPGQTLDDSELRRAEDLFAGLGIEFEEWHVLDKPGGSVVGSQTGFQVEMGHDVPGATALALQIFREVYGLGGDFTLSIEEN